jgi:hypothetical protein
VPVKVSGLCKLPLRLSLDEHKLRLEGFAEPVPGYNGSRSTQYVEGSVSALLRARGNTIGTR